VKCRQNDSYIYKNFCIDHASNQKKQIADGFNLPQNQIEIQTITGMAGRFREYAFDPDRLFACISAFTLCIVVI